MTHPLDHDGDGRKGGSLPKAKRGRPAKVKTDEAQDETKVEAETRDEAQDETRDEAKAQAKGRLKVLKADTVFDGRGGFLPVGAKFDAVDDAAEAALIARGFAE